MSDRKRRQIYSLLRYIKDKQTEINNALDFVSSTHNVKTSQRNAVNKDLKELYLQLEQVHDLFNEYLDDCTDSD